MRAAAMQYTDGILANLEALITQTVHDASARYETLLNSLNGFNDIIKANRSELYPQEEPDMLDLDLEDDEPAEEPKTLDVI